MRFSPGQALLWRQERRLQLVPTLVLPATADEPQDEIKILIGLKVGGRWGERNIERTIVNDFILDGPRHFHSKGKPVGSFQF